MTIEDARRAARHIIFVHGGGVGPWMWSAQRAFFAKHYTVHTPTLPGHAPRNDRSYLSHRNAAESIAEQVGILSLDGDVTVVGFSVGGQVALTIAAMFPEQITRTVVVSSLVSPWRAAPLLATLVATAAPLGRWKPFARAQATQLSIPTEHFDDYWLLSKSISPQTLRETMSANFSFRVPEGVLTSARPVLCIAGSKENRRLITELTLLASRLRHGRFTLIDDVGHGAPLAQPVRFNRILAEWLSTPSTK